MQDLVNGQMRTRKWPIKRGKKRTPAQAAVMEKFRLMQLATKFFAPEMYDFWARQVEGTPLLPRDAMTMMLSNRLADFQLPEGKMLVPVTARNDVSRSLDALNPKPGQTLVRGEEFWEASEPPVSGAALQLLFETELTGQTNIVTDLIEPMQFLWLSLQAFQQPSNSFVITNVCYGPERAVHTGQFAYRQNNDRGEILNQPEMYPCNTGNGGFRNANLMIVQTGDQQLPLYWEQTRGRTGFINSVDRYASAMRITGSRTPFVNGTVRLWGIPA